MVFIVVKHNDNIFQVKKWVKELSIELIIL